MSGPPGAGKSLLAACLPGILPPLTPAEALEVSMVQSIAGLLEGGRISRARPFRAPHHSASMAALTDALDYHARTTGCGLMVEYLLIAGVNDRSEDADALAAFCRERDAAELRVLSQRRRRAYLGAGRHHHQPPERPSKGPGHDDPAPVRPMLVVAAPQRERRELQG